MTNRFLTSQSPRRISREIQGQNTRNTCTVQTLKTITQIKDIGHKLVKFHYTYWMTGNLLKVGNIIGCGQTLWHFLPTLQKSKRVPLLKNLAITKEL